MTSLVARCLTLSLVIDFISLLTVSDKSVVVLFRQSCLLGNKDKQQSSLGLNVIMKRACFRFYLFGYVCLGQEIADCLLCEVCLIYGGLSCLLRVFHRITIPKSYHVISWPVCLFVRLTVKLSLPKLSIVFQSRGGYNIMALSMSKLHRQVIGETSKPRSGKQFERVCGLGIFTFIFLHTYFHLFNETGTI